MNMHNDLTPTDYAVIRTALLVRAESCVVSAREAEFLGKPDRVIYWRGVELECRKVYKKLQGVTL